MTSQPLHLSRGGTSVVLDPHPHGLPTIAYWGPDLGDPDVLEEGREVLFCGYRLPGREVHDVASQPVARPELQCGVVVGESRATQLRTPRPRTSS